MMAAVSLAETFGAPQYSRERIAMYQELNQYFTEHPVLVGSLAVFVLLAAVGAWYVIAHHLHVMLVTCLSAAGFVSGILVFYRGYSEGLRDLSIIGAFLIIIFPVIYHRLIRVAKIAFGNGPSPTAKGHARRAST
jgi:hypothetical protein